jgi:hypothetical protein
MPILKRSRNIAAKKLKLDDQHISNQAETPDFLQSGLAHAFDVVLSENHIRT